MKRLLFFGKNNWRECLLEALCKLLEAGLELAAPFVIATIIDQGIPSVSAGRIIRMWLLLAALVLMGLACSIAAQYFAARISAGLTTRLRHAVFRRTLRLGHTDLDRLGESTITERLTSDIEEIQSGVQLALPLALHSPLILIGAMLAAFYMDTRCGLIFAAAIPVLLAVTFGIPQITVRIRRRPNSAPPKHSLARLAAGLALVALLRIGALQVNAGFLTRGKLVALLSLLGLVLMELHNLSDFFASITRTARFLQRVTALLDLRPSPRAPISPMLPDPGNIGRVDFERVCLRQPGDSAKQLTDISFSARRGQIIGIIGDKSADMQSLLSLILRFRDAASGSVHVSGVNVRSQNLRDLRARIGMVSQQSQLFQGSIRDNLRWGDATADDDSLLEAVRTAQATDALYAAGGLGGQIEPFGKNLSDDQRQRLAVARALVRKPEILILDDSASTLDCVADARLRLALRRLPYRPTVFIASRRAATVRYTDRILVMDGSRIVGDGTHEQLLERCRIYREIFDSQSRKEASA